MSVYQVLKEQWHDSNEEAFCETLPHSKPYLWVCKHKHKWEATISNRKNFGCPVCSGKRVISGINDLAHCYPEIAAQWHPTLNHVKPSEVSRKSSKLFWWVCEKGHEWRTKPLHRVNGSSCPYCSNSKVLPGFNDLATTHPAIADQWDDKNPPVENYSAGSSYKASWVCPGGHSYKRLISDKVRFNSPCSYCSGVELLPGFNDLATVHPEIVGMWYHPKNPTTAEEVLFNSSQKRWWRCELGHEWEAKISAIVRDGHGCLYCSNSKVLAGFNDLAFINPVLSSQWHPTQNAKLPSEFTSNSLSKVWWLGECNHSWEAQISNRAANNTDCPVCASKTVLPGFNDLASKQPNMSTQWHPTKNNGLTPQDVFSSSNQKFWWVCDKGHEWQVSPSSRKAGSGCPVCALGAQTSKPQKHIYSYLLNHGFSVEENNRTLLAGQEVDIYIPFKQIGVEFNGLYWHDENHKPKNYHHDKWVAAKKAGIQLIQIWEDDWNHNPELVKRMLSHKLGVSQERKVPGRKTSVVELSKTDAEGFLEANHIQGHASGSYYLGLKDSTGETVAVLVLKKEAGTEGRTLNIIRYATSCNVVGGFTKLLIFAERTYLPKAFITFADHCVSDGGLYENNGFIVDKILPPDYMYVVSGERKHKFGYRLKRFRNDPTLKFEEGLTERELAVLNNLPRVWDAGKTRYVKEVRLT